jgi:hypothetical protein
MEQTIPLSLKKLKIKLNKQIQKSMEEIAHPFLKKFKKK